MASITRKSTGSRADRREQIVARLMAAVERLLGEGESYTELSVERLVTEAGISRSTFYVYFEDKGALLRALSADIMSQEVAAAQAWWELPPEAGRAQVAAALRNVVEVYRPHETLLAAVVDASSYDHEVREVFEASVNEAVAGITRHIRSGQKGGHVRHGVDPATTAGWLTWMAERGCHQLVRGASDKEVAKLAESLTAIIWSTLYEGVRQEAAPPG